MNFLDKGYLVVTPKGVREVHTFSMQAHNVVGIHYVGGGIALIK